MLVKVSARWVLAGTLAVIGGYWLAVRLLIDAGLEGGSVPYLAHALGGAVVGVSMSLRAPFRPWREPLVAGFLGVAVLAVLALALPSPIGWVTTRSTHPWPAACAAALLSAASACAGALVVRRLSPVAPLDAISLLVLSALVMLGTLMAIAAIPRALALSNASTVLAVGMLAGSFSSSYLTQRLASRYRPWLCGGGIVLASMPFMSFTMSAAEIRRSAIALLGLVLVGAWGARTAWRRGLHDSAPVETEVPMARLEP